MIRRTTIAAIAAILLGLGLMAAAAEARAPACSAPCATALIQARGPLPAVTGALPLPDRQIWAIVHAKVPGRIVSARLQDRTYSFRLVSNRGGIVDVDVDRFSGRVLSVRGGPY